MKRRADSFLSDDGNYVIKRLLCGKENPYLPDYVRWLFSIPIWIPCKQMDKYILKRHKKK